MMRLLRTATTLLLILLPLVAIQAQDDLAEEEQEIRRYTVEMIIFKYAQDVSTGSEIFPGDEPVGESSLVEDDLPLEDEVLPPRPRDIELALLARDEYTMGDIIGRLRRLDVYNPIMHFGWTQITWPEEETEAIHLASLARLPAGLDGSLKLYLSRYLHLVVDLQLDAPDAVNRSAAVDDPVSSYGDYRTLNEYGDITQPGPVRYRINENRILRSGELRYFDHPKFGVLAKVIRVEDEEELPELEETELLGYPIE
ncbi:MAG: CsiV family protein [Woeseiaceae bacterium]